MKKVERRYKELGGIIKYNSKVQKIITNENSATGIKLVSGEIHNGNWIISAADGHFTIFDMLDGKYLNEDLQNLYNSHKLFQPLVQISFGIDADLSKYPHSIIAIQNEEVAGFSFHGLNYKHYCYDKTLAPEGKSVVIVLLPTNFEQWKEIYKDKILYKQKKVEILQYIQKKVEAMYPESQGKFLVTDMATPMTYIRYTGNYKASFEGWYPNFQNIMIKIPKTLPGLNNFYMAGQWVEPGGGIPNAVLSGKSVIDLIDI